MATKTPIKILLYSYSPATVSGLSTVAKNIAAGISQIPNIDLHVYGINDHGNPKDPDEFTYPIYRFADSKDSDIFARNHFLSVVAGEEPSLTPPFDIIMPFLAPHQLASSTAYHPDGVCAFLRAHQQEMYTKKPPSHWFKTIGYFPLDAPPLTTHLEHTVAITDSPVVLSQYAFDQIADTLPSLESAVTHIPPAVNTKTFKPLNKKDVDQFKDVYFRGEVDSSTLLITAIAKNYYLNDLTRTLEIFRQFHTKHPNSFLYLHTDPHGPFVDLTIQAKQMELELFEHWAYSGALSTGQFSDNTELNKIYNASDVILVTSQGSWWGNVILESYATKTLVVSPYHTSLKEHLSPTPLNNLNLTKANLKKIRGIPVAINTNNDAWVTYGSADQHQIRPLMSVTDAVDKLIWIANNQSKTKTIIKNAYHYSQDHDVESTTKLWQDIILKTTNTLHNERQDPQATITKYFS